MVGLNTMVDNTNNIDVSDAFAPVAQADAEILILGSMPSVKSLQVQQYYAHPRNSFWPIMQSLFDFEANLNYVDACQQMINHKIAVWDVIKRCQRNGSLDSNIVSDSIEFNDFKQFFSAHSAIKLIAFNGSKAEQLFNQHCVKH